jgi:hypothetical protein
VATRALQLGEIVDERAKRIGRDRDELEHADRGNGNSLSLKRPRPT